MVGINPDVVINNGPVADWRISLIGMVTEAEDRWGRIGLDSVPMGLVKMRQRDSAKSSFEYRNRISRRGD